ncbi:unnamed protein product [Auanema sp. JU1783]|nr:unnamed protein product [Auanema sp. JU1783]
MSVRHAFRTLSRLSNVMAHKQMSPTTTSFVQRARFCTAPELIFDVTSAEDFQEKVIESAVPVLVDFHADWCGPCRTLGPRLEEKVKGRQGEVVMAKINVDQAGEIAMDYQVTAVPTVISFKGGEAIYMFQGVIEDNDIDDFIERTLNQ